MERQSEVAILSEERTLGAFVASLDMNPASRAARLRTALLCVVAALQERAARGPLQLETVHVREVDGVVFGARVVAPMDAVRETSVQHRSAVCVCVWECATDADV